MITEINLFQEKFIKRNAGKNVIVFFYCFRRLVGIRFLGGDGDLGSMHLDCLLLLLLCPDQETLCQPEADRATQAHHAQASFPDSRGSFEGKRGHCLGRGGQAEAPEYWLAASKPNSKYISIYTHHPLNSF